MSEDEEKTEVLIDLTQVIERINILTWVSDDVHRALDQFLNVEQKSYVIQTLPILFISSDFCEQRNSYITSFPIQISNSLPKELRMIVQTGKNQDGYFTIGVLKLEVVKLKKHVTRFSGKNAEKVRAEIAYVTGRLIDGVFGVTGR